jgi:hypothetical protein
MTFWVLTNANGMNGPSQWIQLNPGPNIPARYNHTATYDPVSGSMTVFSGDLGGGQQTNEVWVLSNANGLAGTPFWTQMSPAGAPLLPRENADAVYDPISNRMTIFGGVNCPGACIDLNDVWVLTSANGNATGCSRGSNIPSILSVQTNRGGNAGKVTATVTGCNFAADATVKLHIAGQADINGMAVQFLDQEGISATFDLTGASTGMWDVVVVNPDLTAASLPAAFSIVSGGIPQLSLSIVGPSLVRVGQVGTFNLAITNSGLVDSVPIVAHMDVPAPFSVVQPPGVTSFNYSGTVPALGSVLIPYGVTSSATQCQQWVSKLWLQESQNATCEFDKFQLDADRAILDWLYGLKIGNDLTWAAAMIFPEPHSGRCVNPPGLLQEIACDSFEFADHTFDALTKFTKGLDDATCANAVAKSCSDQNGQIQCLNDKMDPFAKLESLEGLADVVSAEVDRIRKLVKLVPIPWAQVDSAVSNIDDVYEVQQPNLVGLPSSILLPTYAYGQFNEQPLTTSPPFRVCADNSLDPNSKDGPLGIGSSQYLQGATPLAYTIRFENAPSATGPVQDARIIDPLDQGLDLSSFLLQSIRFGSTDLQIPQGAKAYSNVIDLRPTENALVDVEATLVNASVVVHFTCLESSHRFAALCR